MQHVYYHYVYRVPQMSDPFMNLINLVRHRFPSFVSWPKTCFEVLDDLFESVFKCSISEFLGLDVISFSRAIGF